MPNPEPKGTHTQRRAAQPTSRPLRSQQPRQGLGLTRVHASWAASAVLILAAVALAWWILSLPDQPREATAATPPAQTLSAAVTSSPAATAGAPIPTQVGGIVEVAGTGAQQLRVRERPSLGAPTLYLAKDGTFLQVTGGPAEADGHTWWQVRDQQGRSGWVSAQWLIPRIP